MLETIMTSSVLIIVLILMRYFFKGKINARLQYALWLLVAVRLLLPFSIFSSSLSVLNVVDISSQAERIVSSAVLPQSASADLTTSPNSDVIAGPMSDSEALLYPGQGTQTDSVTVQDQQIPLLSILYTVWLIGAAVVGLWFILQNIWFFMRLQKTREAYAIQGCRRPVYLSRFVKSPCLFGLFRPAIYLHPDSLTDGNALKYILAHEETHFLHGDHLWSYLRCVCLAFHWFNPLVWWAAVLSRRDCEIACDESTLNHIGDEHRAAYGHTLIDMITRRAKPTDLLCGATTMTSGKSGIKERITMIAKKPKMLASSLIAVILIMAAIVGCTFTGANQTTIEPLTGDELLYFNGDEFFNGEPINIRNQFLSSIYASPEKINLFELFYCGSGTEEIPTMVEKAAVVAQNGWDSEPDCPCVKISSDKMNTVLDELMGLNLSDTEKVKLENFTYLAEYDAYYNYHGDTNYRSTIAFYKGEREGDIIRLYYDDVFYADGKKILTLQKKDGGYLFISNVYDGNSNGGKTNEDVTLYERSGVTIAIPKTYSDQLLIDPVELDEDTALINVYQRSTYEKYEGMGLLFSLARYTEAQYEQFLCSDGSGQRFFAKDGTFYYGFFFATDVQAPDDNESFRALFTAVGDFVRNDMISRNGLIPYRDDEFFNKSYTYDSAHVFLSYYPYLAFTGSKEEVWTLILSQPVTQGETGIWCVERWKDQNGNIYPYFPDENGTPSKDYYAALQSASDAGTDRSRLVPEEAALAFVKRVFDHSPATLDSFARSDNPAAPADLFAVSTGDIHDYMPQLLAGSAVSDYELLPCLERFTHSIWNELDGTYDTDWWNPLWIALRDAAVSEMQPVGDDQSLRDYYIGKAYLASDGAYSEGLSELVMQQWQLNSTIYSACLDTRFSAEEASSLRQSIMYSISYSESMFGLGIPVTGRTLSLDAYPVDFPFGFDFTEVNRETHEAETYGRVTVVESDGLQVTYLTPSEGVYAVITVRTVKNGYSVKGAAIGDTESALLDKWHDQTLERIDSISYDDEAWFGKTTLAYAYTPEDGTKSVVFIIKDGLVWGIELINGLDGAMY